MEEYRALGMVELKSIARGYEAADHLVKTAQVEFVTARTTCPGKFIIIIRGSISAVRASLDQAIRLCGEYIVDTFLLGNPDDQVFDALVNQYPYQETNAMGIVETWTAAAALVAADQGVKAAQANVIKIGLARELGGKGIRDLYRRGSRCPGFHRSSGARPQSAGQTGRYVPDSFAGPASVGIVL